MFRLFDRDGNGRVGSERGFEREFAERYRTEEAMNSAAHFLLEDVPMGVQQEHGQDEQEHGVLAADGSLEKPSVKDFRTPLPPYASFVCARMRLVFTSSSLLQLVGVCEQVKGGGVAEALGVDQMAENGQLALKLYNLYQAGISVGDRFQ